ncbi:retrovirus-related pol polyprotein from transposon TNT 1-94 [Tanacetum coccineum]
MLEKSMYDSWASHVCLFIKRKKHGRMILDSFDNGPLVYPTVKENGQSRPKKYSELTDAQQLQDDCNVQATNIILHSLPPDVLYNLFDKFAHVPGETLYEYYWRFSQVTNDMHTIRMTMQQVQANTKFLNALPSEWSKFVTDVKLAKSLYTTNYDQFQLSNSLQSISVTTTFREDLIECINKVMAFLSAVASRLPPSKNQLRISSNPRNQATIQDGRVTVQQVQRIQNQSYVGTRNRGIATTSKGNVAVDPPRVVKCYNYQGEGHMARQCTQPKRPRNATWFKEKLMLAEAQEAGQILDEEQLAFLVDPDCDDLSSAKAVLMANLSSCDPDVLSEVPYSDSYPNDMINQDVQEIQYSEQTHVDDFEDNEIHSVLSLVEQMTDHSVEKETYDKLVKSYSNLEKHCISLELATQLNQEIFQRENSGENLNAPTFNQLFEINKLKAQSQENDIVIRKLKERIKSLSGKNSVEKVKKYIDEIETINIELKHSVAKLLSKNENLRKEREYLKSIYKDQFDLIGKTHIQSKEHCDSLIAQINAKSLEKSDLNAQLQEKVFAITTFKNELWKHKGKNVINTVVSKPKATIAPGMFKLDIEPISSRLKNNIDAHEVYIEKNIEYANTLHGFVEHARTQVKPTTSASGSKPSCNTKNNRITRPPRSNQKNKVEDHPRKVKSSLNKMNFVSKLINNALVKHSVRNAKFEFICAICNKCLFNANHDICLVDFVNDVNVHLKSKSKRNKKRKAWKPMSKVFTDVGYKWKPTGRFFTIVGNSYLLTRITPKKIVHLKETTPKSVETPKPDIKVYSRRLKQIKSVGDPDRPLVSRLWMFKTYDRVPLSAHQLRSQDTNLYTISLDDMLKTSSIYLLSKALKTKSWLWHRRLSHLKFGTLNKLAKDGLARGPALQVLTHATSSLGLVPNIIPQQPCNPPKRDNWDTLLQPLFDEYFNPTNIVVSTVLVVDAPRAVKIADSPVSTSIDQDAPLSSIPSIQDQEHSPIISQGSLSNVRPSHTSFELIGRWTKDPPIENVIGHPSRSVSTRKQLKIDAMWCYFDAFLTSVEPKNFKQAMTEPS